ncbi:hypothetical protein CIK05_03840 [Bdellovibrio sp. qaytius]|nr:hypothetical protein CIK05_03840 [Bdellovibrio sp. qaytius]
MEILIMSKKGRLLLGIAGILFLSFGGLYFAIQAWMPFMWFILAPAVGAFFGWIYYDRKLLYELMTMKTTKHGLNMGALVLIALVALVGLNILSAKKNKSFDFTTVGLHTLSPLSVQVLNQLDSDLNVKFFYKEGAENVEANRKAFAQTARMYAEASSNIKIDYVEMNSNPKTTADFGANRPIGEVFIEYKGQKNRIESQFLGSQGQKFNEQDFTNAIIKVTRKEKKIIYIVEGDEERDIEDEKNQRGVSSFVQLLEKNSYVVKKINLVKAVTIPDEANAVVILGPQSALQKFELDAVTKYLTNGGSLLLTLDDKNTAGFAGLLNTFGLKLEPQYIFNVINSPMGQVVSSNEPTVAVDYSPSNPITKVFTSNQKALFVAPNSLAMVPIGPDIKNEIIVRTPEASVALLKMDSSNYEGKPRSFNIMAEVNGKLDKAVKPFKAVVAADTDFLSNGVIFQNVNRDIALNSMSYLLGDSDLISIAPKDVGITQMLMSPPEFSQFYKFVVMGIFFPLPFLFLGISIVLWLRRRHA